jgi:8-oxo-dGTP diphosphatase
MVVDAANVMGSRPDGWWRDRPAAAARLHADLVRLAGREVTVPVRGDTVPVGEFILVLEGAARAAMAHISPDGSANGSPVAAEAPEGVPVRVVLAMGSGDEAIVAAVRELSGECVVVTADRELRRRCETFGASVLGPGWMLSQFEE